MGPAAYVLGENGEHLNETPIKVTNSLTRTKVGLLFTSFPQVPFITMIPRKVLWYSCGPTVYDVHTWPRQVGSESASFPEPT